MSIDNLWTAGGIVSIPLLVFSLLAIALIIERIIFWGGSEMDDDAFVRRFYLYTGAIAKLAEGIALLLLINLRKMPIYPLPESI